jgi:RNA polymerase sigma-70 factor (ECF subfamily)
MTDPYDAFCGLLRENRKAMFRVALGILRNSADAEDAVSEATVKAYTYFNKLRKTESFKPWVMRILVNEAYAVANKRRQADSLEDIPEEPAVPGGEAPLLDSLALWDAVRQLEDEFRAVTILFYYEDMSIKEIAGILQIPVGTVNSRLSRSREKLRAILKE